MKFQMGNAYCSSKKNENSYALNKEDVLVYELNRGLRHPEQNEIFIVLSHPTKENIPLWPAGDEFQWCDAINSKGEICILWNLVKLEKI